ncbi:MAG: TolC family protein [Candidatus Omnitrophica bacterium]|nr:TolC family protein [Candidatus Omnitrophota bacterium]
MKQKVAFIILMVLGITLLSAKWMIAQEGQVTEKRNEGRSISLKEFIDLAVTNDTEFERILIDELAFQYKKDLVLPAGDLVLEVKARYDLFLNPDKEEPEAAFSLSRLFPYAGTELTAEYTSTPSATSTINSSEFAFTVSQPIAENAFGKATRLKDKIVGVEIDVARHQIIEAYEDYLAAIITGYYDWHEAYENLRIGESSYAENLKLMDNIKERQKSSIALDIDVNKINLQVLAKKETLIGLQEKYENALNFIKEATRYSADEVIVPQEPDIYEDSDISFESDYKKFKKESRTHQILKLLEDKSSLEVDENADDLLPSINLLIGYNVDGDDHEIRDEETMAYAAISMEWPFPDQIERAEYETAKIALDKQKLTTTSTRYRLYTDIKDLFQSIDREEQLGVIAREKISLAQAVLEDETENYSFGKITINDYIQAVNVLDSNRFNQVLHDAQYRKFTIEWLRITDRLVSKKDIYK